MPFTYAHHNHLHSADPIYLNIKSWAWQSRKKKFAISILIRPIRHLLKARPHIREGNVCLINKFNVMNITINSVRYEYVCACVIVFLDMFLQFASSKYMPERYISMAFSRRLLRGWSQSIPMYQNASYFRRTSLKNWVHFNVIKYHFGRYFTSSKCTDLK